MSLKLGLKLTRYYSINFDLPKRNKKKITFIILHYTGMKKETQAIDIYKFTGRKLGQGLAMSATILAPEAFI